ncbi:threonine--tRNA ligase [Burkholderia pseudomallei]|nr:threonine--tRNA ligase [Burkholderia pseudomallei]
MISALYFSPMLRKYDTASSRDTTRRVTGSSRFASSCMRFSIASRSSGVNGR